MTYRLKAKRTVRMTSLQRLQEFVLLEDNKQHKERLKLKEKNDAYWDGRGIKENSLVSPNTLFKIVSLRDEPVSFEHFTNRDPNVTGTKGSYTIRYIPESDTRYIKGLHYQIGQDFLYWRVMCSGYTQWKALAKKIPELGWIDRNSTLTHELFAIAKCHPGIAFNFTVDWVKYSQMINQKAKEMGLDIDNKPFVAYACSFAEYENKFYEKQLADKKTYNDYVKEIAEVRKEVTDNGE